MGPWLEDDGPVTSKHAPTSPWVFGLNTRAPGPTFPWPLRGSLSPFHIRLFSYSYKGAVALLYVYLSDMGCNVLLG